MIGAFAYRDGQLMAEGIALGDIAARFGTPCYVYSRQAIEARWQAYNEAFGDTDHLICYAVKANSNLAILDTLARLGSGFDIVSGGELQRVIEAGGEPEKTVFSGVGKQADEMHKALDVGIKCFNVESLEELDRLNQVAAERDVKAPVSFRVNPDVDVKTHPYIATGLKQNKFGIPWEEAFTAYEQAASMNHIEVTGIDCHIGSQITAIDPFINALERLMDLTRQIEAAGITLRHIDVGGGLGIPYKDESPPTEAEFVSALRQVFANRVEQIIIEPGRSIVGNAGVLLTRVEYLKHTPHKNFAIVDAAMNDLLRPSLYGAWHEILPVHEAPPGEQTYDIVGPVCETGDFLGQGRTLDLRVGDLLAVGSAGAYGFCMSSNYNTRPRACEVMLDKGVMHEIRKRETVADLLQPETTLP
ncbi:MAG: diaminopimelate decarboxylase [Gammaproteobacteria bacterium]|nr:diaminopimelate decarboxylase [Gammaproteobacteria bacterium]NIO61662.1 diaminopimelate decarboxylase [Gammaproteobacteria bacterium]NIP49209.1 diaminopimelate decarboxylase [Gammaproteobacteria bacterium]NIQ10073.1 diaminopimelate decarboxylase [Gammaproteobacteria bacterium]NIQ18913.1 diaminopimelate decarboxylase [Gammaproteobacteria bacterium]